MLPPVNTKQLYLGRAFGHLEAIYPGLFIWSCLLPRMALQLQVVIQRVRMVQGHTAFAWLSG